MTGYVSKPVRRNELFVAISEAANFAPMNLQSPPEPDGERRSDSPEKEEEGLVNWDASLEAVGHDVELLQEVVAVFVEECPQPIQQLKDSVRDGDLETLQRTAHTIQGTMRLYQVPAVSEIAESLEETSSVSDAEPRVAELERILRLVIPELRRFAESAQ